MNRPAVRTEISRQFRLEAAHRLPHVPPDHKCARLHGHSFSITVTVGGEVDPKLGWIVDFAELDRAFQPIHAALDHRYLNEVEGLDNPTSENLARWILQRLKLPRGKVLSVSVGENAVTSCTVYDD